MSANDRQRAEDLDREVKTLRQSLSQRDAELDALRAELSALRATAEAPQLAGEATMVCKIALKHNGVVYPVGAAMPFDPEHPPVGCDGLREGVHYERLRVLAQPIAARA